MDPNELLKDDDKPTGRDKLNLSKETASWTPKKKESLMDFKFETDFEPNHLDRGGKYPATKSTGEEVGCGGGIGGIVVAVLIILRIIVKIIARLSESQNSNPYR
ncbi:MAG: hypothetical protein IJM30_10015 [Thermoguttaceae bacterium]|nr:hypothetical protein [Thermoguttaceae bacterium]